MNTAITNDGNGFVSKRIILKADYYQPVPVGGVKPVWWFKKGDDISFAKLTEQNGTKGYMATPRTVPGIQTFATQAPVFVPFDYVEYTVPPLPQNQKGWENDIANKFDKFKTGNNNKPIPAPVKNTSDPYNGNMFGEFNHNVKIVAYTLLFVAVIYGGYKLLYQPKSS